MSTSDDLRSICKCARPVIEQWLELAAELVELREAATKKGLDWGQLKALLKAQIEDERDERIGSSRVKRLIEKAEFACAYADMLGLVHKGERQTLAPVHLYNNDGLDIPDYLRRTPPEASAPSDGSPGDAAGHARRS